MKNKLQTFLMMIVLSIPVSGQTPGGIKGYDYWFSAEDSKDTIVFKVADETINFRTSRKIDDKNPFRNINSNKKSGDATIFVVMRPSFQQEKSEIAEVNLDNRNISIQSDRIYSKGKNLKIKNFAEKKPFLLSYTESVVLDSIEIKNTRINEIERKFEGEIAEIIFYPKFLSKLNRRKIETYLSLKHGISLGLNADYINSVGDTIWKANENPDFPNRVTGIGWDFQGNFNNRQASNVDDYQFLTIGFGNKVREKNSKVLSVNSDLNYLLWSDNGETPEFEGEDEFPLILNRVWSAKMMGSSLDKENISLRFNFNVLSENKDAEPVDENKLEGDESKDDHLKYWLIASTENNSIIDPYNAKFTAATNIDNEGKVVEFDDFPLSEFDRNFLFTLTKAPEFFALVNQENENCESNVRIKIIGGTSPFTVSVFDTNFRELKSEIIGENEFILNNMDASEYTYHLTDADGKTFKNKFTVHSKTMELIPLPDIYLTRNQSKTINLNDFTDLGAYKISWLRDDVKVGNGTRNAITKKGNYEVQFQNQNGCIQSSYFKVFELPQNNWTGIFPNPVGANEDFFIKLEDTDSLKKITISDTTGRILKTKKIKSNIGIYADRYPLKGIYTITVESQNQIQQYTLIIK